MSYTHLVSVLGTGWRQPRLMAQVPKAAQSSLCGLCSVKKLSELFSLKVAAFYLLTTEGQVMNKEQLVKDCKTLWCLKYNTSIIRV